jgi:hypothetical protein
MVCYRAVKPGIVQKIICYNVINTSCPENSLIKKIKVMTGYKFLDEGN